MPAGYDANWSAVIVAAGVSLGAMLLMFAASWFLSPRRRLPRKGIAIECGILPGSMPRVQIQIRYYIFAILFLIFDVEAVFIFPWAVVFMSLQNIPAVFYEMFLFIGILSFGIVYGWRKGVLQWM